MEQIIMTGSRTDVVVGATGRAIGYTSVLSMGGVRPRGAVGGTATALRSTLPPSGTEHLVPPV